MRVPELRAAIARAGVAHQDIAVQLGLSRQGFYNKLNNNSEFKNSEIKKLVEILGLTMNDVDYIFFNG